MSEKSRKSNYPINPMILNRHSSRAMSGQPMTDQELMPLFEAARWAPSCYNNQPWRFIYAKRDTKHFDKLFSLLVEFNQSWTKNAAVLAVIISKKTFDKNSKPARTHSFDTGSAFENLALQGTSLGYVVHGMEGFDYEKAKTLLHIPDDHQVEAMLAIGKKAPIEVLSKELQEKEVLSDRRPLSEILMEGTFKK